MKHLLYKQAKIWYSDFFKELNLDQNHSFQLMEHIQEIIVA